MITTPAGEYNSVKAIPKGLRLFHIDKRMRKSGLER